MSFNPATEKNMSINRHNYEEFFILYLDNELRPEDRRMVEIFVQQHPDLKEELDSLLQYKLTPDESVVFPLKEDLMMDEGNTMITSFNYPEWLTLYIDGELDSELRARVEEFVAGHPEAQTDLNRLQQVKLTPEPVEFKFKNTLYRKEEKVRPMFPVRWWRAAAAILLLTAGLSAVFILNRKPGSGVEVAKTIPAREIVPADKNSPDQPRDEKNTDLLTKQPQSPVQNPYADQTPEIKTIAGEETRKQSLASVNRPASPSVSENRNRKAEKIRPEEPVIAETKTTRPSNNLPEPVNNPHVVTSRPEESVAYTPVPGKSEIKSTTRPADVTSSVAQPLNIVQASYQDNADGLLDQPDNRKNKNRGIFRKIARTFEKRTRIDPTDDEERLLVGGLAIRLK